jgi:hypothetical protein
MAGHELGDHTRGEPMISFFNATRLYIRIKGETPADKMFVLICCTIDEVPQQPAGLQSLYGLKIVQIFGIQI